MSNSARRSSSLYFRLFHPNYGYAPVDHQKAQVALESHLSAQYWFGTGLPF